MVAAEGPYQTIRTVEPSRRSDRAEGVEQHLRRITADGSILVSRHGEEPFATQLFSEPAVLLSRLHVDETSASVPYEFPQWNDTWPVGRWRNR